jgi:hypothetical protein
LSLSKVIDLTLEKYPDVTWLNSLEEEAAALSQRGDSWTAGASEAGLGFQEATSGTLHYIDAYVKVPLWNLGQRDAESTSRWQKTAQCHKRMRLNCVAGLIKSLMVCWQT